MAAKARAAMQSMDEIERSDENMLRPCDVASVLHVMPYAVNLMVRDGKCPFPAFRSGNRVKIPRLAFISWYYGGNGK